MLEISQESTYRLYQSMIATRYMNPRAIGIYVLVRAPYLIGPNDLHPFKQIRVYFVFLGCLACARLGVDRTKPHFLHQPLDALVVDLVTKIL